MGEIIAVPEEVFQELTIIDSDEGNAELHRNQIHFSKIQRPITSIHPNMADFSASKDDKNHLKISCIGCDPGNSDTAADYDNYGDESSNASDYSVDHDQLDFEEQNNNFFHEIHQFYESEENSSDCLNTIAYDDSCLHVESLLSMTPDFQGQDVVCIAARNLFLSKVKSQSCVKDVFFTDHKKDPYEYLVDSNWFDFETYAVLYICQVISRCNDPYNLHAMIDGDKCDLHLNDLPSCPEWKKVGFALYTTLFPDLVKDAKTSVPFRAYLNSDRKYWASQMYDTIRDNTWLYKIMQPIISGKVNELVYNRNINQIFVKLHLLDPTLVMPAYHQLQKALPGLNLQLATTNYLGGPLDWTLAKHQVEEVMNRAIYQRRVSKLSLESVDVYYGVELLEFLMREPKELELLSNRKPDNRRTTTFRDRCTIM